MQTVLAVLFALLAALSNALATVLQRYAARTVPLTTGLRLALIGELLRKPVWLVGFGAVIAAAAFQALALLNGELTLVQPLFVLELPFAMFLAGIVLRRRLPPRGWAAVACMVVGLGVGLWAASPSGGVNQPRPELWAAALPACCAAVLLLVAVAARRPEGRVRATCFGASAAICYALTAGLLKDATQVWNDEGPGAFFTAWQTYGFALVGVAAVFLLENAMQSGPLVASQPALTLGDATVSLALGVTVFEERLRGGWYVLPMLLGAFLVICGALILVRVPLIHTLVGPGASDGEKDGRKDGGNGQDGQAAGAR
ncbi:MULTISPECIES: DMT family transporter [unclassified Streptomyces]|uniref:DMT family transporter n=1 Tax=unclassified Streptomyces TaxID=2593676 RepID=UPI0038081375